MQCGRMRGSYGDGCNCTNIFARLRMESLYESVELIGKGCEKNGRDIL